MNAPGAGFWLQTCGLLAVQSALLLLAAGLAQRLTRAARDRRAVWLATLAALALLLVNSLAGLDCHVAGWFVTKSQPAPQFSVRANLPVESAPTGSATGETQLFPAEANDAVATPTPSTIPASILWPAWLWLAGAGVVGIWAMLPRAWLAFAGRRTAAAESPEFQRRIQGLARRLNRRRRVRVVCLPRLAGPVAFGVLRPSIGLPADFWTANSVAEQDAMLAHELAHLAARDPLWLALADVLLALLWWHPLVWWARRQFRAASETAADEASLLVENGPAVLAACLVTLASRWQQRGVLGLLGMAGFRSGLGRRVERLLRLRGSGPPVRQRRWPDLAAWLGAVAILALLVAVPARLFPAQAADRPALLAVIGEALAPAAASAPARIPPDGTPFQPASTALHPVSGDNVPLGVPAARSGEASATNAMFTRTFRVEPRTLAAGLESVTGQGQTNLTAQAQLRAIFTAAGLDFAPLNPTSADKPPARAFFYNDRNGILLVRATMPELDTVEQLLQVLNTAQPQVLIEAKFVEVAVDANSPLGFDWLLGNVLMGSNAPGRTVTGGTNGVFPGPGLLPTGEPAGGDGDITGILTDPQFREAIAALEKSGTNGVHELRGHQFDWPGRHATNAENIRVTAVQGGTLAGLLTEGQYRVVLQALEQRAGVDVLSAPLVITLSGRQAQIQIADLRTVVTGVNAEVLKLPGATALTNGPAFITASIPTGPTLDIIPFVATDGATIELTLTSTVTEFMGYDAPPGGAGQRAQKAEGGESNPSPLPRFRVRQMTAHQRVPDGQTLVLGGFPVEATIEVKDKVAVMGDLPVASGVFHRESKSTVRKQLLVFVTPTLIDPAGNPVHEARHRPFEPASAPPASR